MIKVLFTGENLRERRKETIRNPPKGVVFSTVKPLEDMRKDYHAIPKKVKEKKKRIVNIVKKIGIPNIKKVNKDLLKEIDLVYTPGHLITNRVPYVVEIDNVCCLGYYSYKAVYNPLSKWFIKKCLISPYCKKIVCISNAAKKSVVNTFKDDKITKKCEVVYPFIKKNKVIRKKQKKIIFLSCNRKFYQKATENVLEAFSQLKKKHNNIELWVISNTPEDIKERYSSKNIKFFEAKFNKKELYDKFYAKADVFVQPTLQDSFGMVYLETMANDMAIITTDLFAIPELVENKKNGLLIKAPFYMFSEEYLPIKKYFPREKNVYEKYAKDSYFTKRIEEAMEKIIKNPEMMRSMQEASGKIIKKKFNEKKRKEKLRKIFEEAKKD